MRLRCFHRALEPRIHQICTPSSSKQAYTAASAPRHVRTRTAPDNKTPPAVSADDLLSQLDDLDIPDIDQDLRTFQAQAGALFLDTSSPPVSFGNDDAAEDALLTGAVVVDRSDAVRVRVAGPECRQFMHNMTTNTFLNLAAGTGCTTVIVTPQARCLDTATCYAQSDSIMLTMSAQGAPAALGHLTKYILDDKAVTVQDMSTRCSMFVLMGEGAEEVMGSLGVTQLKGAPLHAHTLLNFKGSPVLVAVGSGLATPGYTCIVDEAVAGDLWLLLVGAKGCIPMGSSGWERQRVLQGCPASGSELTLDYNPLEAGLSAAVSLDKGCYMGQETLAKVSNLNAIKQRLMGVQLDKEVQPGAVVMVVEEDGGRSKGGVVTSCTEGEDGTGGFAMGYIKAKHATQDTRVLVDGVRGLLVELECARWGVAQGTQSDEEAEDSENDDAEAAAEEEARQARLKEMQARLDAWKQQQAS